MAKKPVKLTADDLKEMIQLETGSQAAEVAEAVFEKLFKEFKDKMDGRISQLVYGGIIATILVLIALFFSTWLFMSSYQQSFLDSQANFSQDMNTTTKENADLQLQYKTDIESLKEKQMYLERLLLEKRI